MITLEPTNAAEIAPGHYQLNRGERKDKIIIVCPKCEGEFQLPAHFMVSAAGVLNPEVLCPLFGCGSKYPATLAKWKARNA